jgi:hypothetical protein
MALLAAYMAHKMGHKEQNESLEAYLNDKVFAGESSLTISPVQKDVEGFATFMERYKAGLVIEKAAVEALN